MRRVLRFASTALFVLLPGAARAAHFDDATGQVMLDDSPISFGFETSDAVGALTMFDRRGNELTGAQVDAQIVQQGIQGQQALAVGGPAFLAQIDLAMLTSAMPLHGRRVEIKYWHRGQGSRAVGHVVWSADGQSQLAELPFQLTGRGTDDGWREWTSGPFDFTLAGKLDPSAVLFYSNQGGGGGGMQTTDPPVGLIDAVSVDDLGAAAVPSARCNLASEATACGPSGACMLGQCTDAAVAAGPAFLNPSHRADYLTRRGYEFTHLEGGRAPESKAQQFTAAMTALAADASPVHFRAGFLEALQLLEDGHTSPPSTRSGASRQTGICLHLGSADLLPQGGELPLVFSLSTTSTLAARLRPGDALVSIDGMPVNEWATAASRYVAYFGDQRGRKVVAVPEILTAAAAIGSVVSFARPSCPVSSPVAACAANQITTISIDLGAEEASAWTGAAPSWFDDPIACDFRFHRAFAGPAGTDYTFAGHADADGIRTLQINGVPAQQSQGGQEWFDAVSATFTGAPGKLILDQRTGFGGGIDAVDHLAGFLVGPTDFDRMFLCTRTAQNVDQGLLGMVHACLGAGGAGVNSCGDFLEWQLGEGMQTASARTASVAVLVGYDVSGNDFLTRLLTYRRGGATRIFGGTPTAGAFGVIWELPAVSHEMSGGSIQVQDTIFRSGPQDLNLEFQTSHGVPPDEVILQRQSDAVRDIDTMVEAARAWLNR